MKVLNVSEAEFKSLRNIESNLVRFPGLIDSYEFGTVVMNGRRYTSDVMVFPERVIDGWWRKEGHNLCIEDIESVMKEEPDIVIVGTGVNRLMRVPDQTRKYVESKGANLVVESTGRACDIYNQVSEKAKVVAALHLTC